MTADADALSAARTTRLAALEEAERVEAAAEDEARKKAASVGGKGSFMREQEKMVFGGMNLEERVRRGRGGMVKDGE